MKTEFVTELRELLVKYGLHLHGNMRLVPLAEKWDSTSATLAVYPDIFVAGIRDGTGPFLCGHIEEKPRQASEIKASKTIHINPDIAGYDCPVTGQWIGSRREHRENLKRKNCRLLEPGEKRESIKDRAREQERIIDRVARDAVISVARNMEI